MNAQELSIKYSPIHWLILTVSIATFTLLFVPLEALIYAGNQILPFGTVLNKTILLFQALKIAIPAMGGIGIAWLLAPDNLRRALANKIDRIARSPWSIPVIL